jgi:adenosylmethionine-8-amino-7-oxononanoate aminotransferase
MTQARDRARVGTLERPRLADRELANLLRTDAEHLIHPLQHPSDHSRPLVLVRGEGAELIDAEGKRYFDSLAGLWNVAVGHGRKELALAAAEQMETLAFCSSYVGFVNVPSVELAERLVALSYPTMKAAYFTTGGAESNESAFKIARFVQKMRGKPDKVKIISRRWGYHGVTMAAASATGLPVYHKMFAPLVPNFLQVVGPYRFRCELEGEAGPRPCTDPAGHDYAAALEQTILAEGPETVAAIIAEPVQGAGGVIVPPDDYWPKLRALADKYELVLIADEIITGFGRTGKMFALDHWGVQPDIVSFAKAVTSAYLPLGGVLVSAAIQDDVLNAPADMKFTHAATYSGHPACCAVGLANLDIIEREGLVSKAAQLGPWFIERLGQLKSLPQVGDVRGLGLLAGVELVDREATGAAFYDNMIPFAARVARACMQRGLILRLRGNVICLAPPLISTREQLDRVASIIGEAIQATAAEG